MHKRESGFDGIFVISSPSIISRDRKREAESSVEEPESKRPRTSDELVEEVSTAADQVHPEKNQDEEKSDEIMVDLVDQEPSTETVPQGRSEEKRTKKDKSKESGFKENPYTFLSPDDPILLSCL